MSFDKAEIIVNRLNNSFEDLLRRCDRLIEVQRSQNIEILSLTQASESENHSSRPASGVSESPAHPTSFPDPTDTTTPSFVSVTSTSPNTSTTSASEPSMATAIAVQEDPTIALIRRCEQTLFGISGDMGNGTSSSSSGNEPSANRSSDDLFASSSHDGSDDVDSDDTIPIGDVDVNLFDGE